MWETKIVIIPFEEVGKDPDYLNAKYLAYWGKEGWELVSAFIQMGGVGWVFVFKGRIDNVGTS